jgi:ribosomal protein S14
MPTPCYGLEDHQLNTGKHQRCVKCGKPKSYLDRTHTGYYDPLTMG